MVPGLVFSQENPYKVEAAFLRNFAHYIIWPDHAFVDSQSPWQICILGEDPFGDSLETTFEGRTEGGRSFVIFRADKLENLPPCQIIFVAVQDAGKRRIALNALKDKPVLTVGDAPDFMNEGGVIRFAVSDRVSMGINLDQSRRAALSIKTKMLEVATDIIENGKLRRVR